VHGEFLWPQMGVEKVNRENESGRKERFVTMDDGRYIKRPPREKPAEKFGKPEKEAGQADHADAPEYGPVIKFFPVGPLVEFRPRTESEKPPETAVNVQKVLDPGDHGLRADNIEFKFPDDGDVIQNISNVRRKITEGDDGANPVDEAGGMVSAEEPHEPCRPRRVGVLEGHAGGHESDETYCHGYMENPVVGVEPLYMYHVTRLPFFAYVLSSIGKPRGMCG